ncbi:MAG: hypothetical protein ACI936_003923 [Paraglaciecola sp.]|jgi:hypothetical protein
MTSFAVEDPIEVAKIGYVAHVYPKWKSHMRGKLYSNVAAKISMMITE